GRCAGIEPTTGPRFYNRWMKTLRGKVVLITGASSGIGRATALRLASAGARLVLASRGVEALEGVCREAAALGAEAIAVPTDVTQREPGRRAGRGGGRALRRGAAARLAGSRLARAAPSR